MRSDVVQNLLRTLASSQAKLSIPDADLKRLFQVVKDCRVSRIQSYLTPSPLTLATSQQKQPHDAKLADPFYDALEDLLHDLRTVTMVHPVVPNYQRRSLTSSVYPG